MNFKKYGLGNSTEINFRKNHGINLRSKNSFLKNTIKNVFNCQTVTILKEKKLFKNVKKNIDFHKNIIKSYKGTRHRRGYPVRGQRTHTNATKKVFKKKNFL